MGRVLRRHGFTLATLLALTVVALVTESQSDSLSGAWLRRWGFAPRDLFAGRWWRLLTSALATHGEWVFLRACVMVAFFVGLAERRAGTPRAALTFWGVHLAVLTLLALGVRAGWLEPVLGPPPLPRDVGPSAGALGCLGLLVATLEPRQRLAVGGAIAALLVALLFIPPLAPVDARVDMSADLLHLLAFAIGFGSALLWRSRRPE